MVTDEEFQELKERVSKLEAIFVKKEFSTEKKELPFGTFMKQKNPKTHEERVITIGFYLKNYENRDFTYDDITEYSKKVAWPTYSNPAVLIRQLKSKGWIEEVGKNLGGKIEYRILIDAINFVENNFLMSK